MANWTFNSNEYTAREFALIPEGDHRVRITDVSEKIYATGNEGFQITLEVNGHGSKLWYHLILDPIEHQKTNQRLGMFFDSFGITDYDLSHYDNWVGRDGAVRVRHGAYKGSVAAQVAFCLNRSQQNRLPGWGNQVSACENRTTSAASVNTHSLPQASPMSFEGFKF